MPSQTGGIREEAQMATSIKYDGGLTCALGVSDIDESIRWYQDVLGFKLLYRMDALGWCELKTPVSKVNVGLSKVEKLSTGGGATLTFGVEDIDQARAQLEEKGVRFDGPTRTIADTVKLATFYDPDGNTLMFYQDIGS
jgi:catechol 2,3-dioxygenase-like lactoylglutathione lyase family enzyme